MKKIFSRPNLLLIAVIVLVSCNPVSSTSNNTLSAQPATIPVTGQTVQPSPTVAATATIPATPTPAEPVELTVLYAGSLIIPFKAIETAFEAEYPQVDVLMEGHGSIQVIRHITELGELVDVAALADYALVPKMMYQANDPESGMPYANWTIQFASNKMVLAYTPESQFSDEIDQDNWRQILADERVIKGFSDPRFDACGYRALMVLQLAEYLTGQQTVFENILMGKFKTPIITVEEDSHTVIKVPEILQTKANSDIIIRSYSVQLIALLESGDVDYAFLYETVAKQHNLEYLELPPAINLGENDQSDQYQKVSVLLDFQRFASVPPHFTGEVIAYGLTIPSNTPHQEWAETFIEFLLSPQGRSVMEANGHPLLDQYTVDSPGNLPSKLVELVEIEDGR